MKATKTFLLLAILPPSLLTCCEAAVSHDDFPRFVRLFWKVENLQSKAACATLKSCLPRHPPPSGFLPPGHSPRPLLFAWSHRWQISSRRNTPSSFFFKFPVKCFSSYVSLSLFNAGLFSSCLHVKLSAPTVIEKAQALDSNLITLIIWHVPVCNPTPLSLPSSTRLLITPSK